VIVPLHHPRKEILNQKKIDKEKRKKLVSKYTICYELKPLALSKRTNSCMRVNIRELNKELYTK